MKQLLLFLLLLTPVQALAQVVQVHNVRETEEGFVPGKASGVLVAKDLCVSAGHVVDFEVGKKVVVILDNKSFDAVSVEINKGADIAILKVEGNNTYSPVRVGGITSKKIVMRGYIYSEPHPVIRQIEGTLAGFGTDAEGGTTVYLFNGKPVPGMSGGPIYDEEGVLVSVCSGYTDSYGVGGPGHIIKELLEKVKK